MDSRGDIISAMNALTERRKKAGATEKEEINAALLTLQGLLQDLDQASLLRAARTVASASDELEKIIATARTGPFDQTITDVEAALQRLQDRQAEMQAVDRLPSADREEQPLPVSAVAAAAPAAAPAAPAKSTVYADLRAEYEGYYGACRVKPEFQGNVDFYVSRIRKFKPKYDAVGAPLNIPWYFIGIVHGLECGFNFGSHLHNGDPLTAKTVRVPPNRPPTGNPPFPWADSAKDALVLKGYHQNTDWTVPHVLYLLEKYNGFGYRKLGVPTPYLWSFSNMYVKGKYVADHKFNADAVSEQCGAALMLKSLQAAGEL